MKSRRHSLHWSRPSRMTRLSGGCIQTCRTISHTSRGSLLRSAATRSIKRPSGPSATLPPLPFGCRRKSGLTETPSFPCFRETLLPEHEDAFTLLDQMDEVHPKYRHWYPPWFGVHAGSQGQGLGGQLMDHCLRVVDQGHLPAYLESPNPRNVSFYERHGFVVAGVAEAGACPPIVFMLREAQ
jgi:hypothetical protein